MQLLGLHNSCRHLVDTFIDLIEQLENIWRNGKKPFQLNQELMTLFIISILSDISWYIQRSCQNLTLIFTAFRVSSSIDSITEFFETDVWSVVRSVSSGCWYKCLLFRPQHVPPIQSIFTNILWFDSLAKVVRFENVDQDLEFLADWYSCFQLLGDRKPKA